MSSDGLLCCIALWYVVLCRVPVGLQPLPAAGKEKSVEYLTQCLEVVGIRAETLTKIIDGYSAYVVRLVARYTA